MEYFYKWEDINKHNIFTCWSVDCMLCLEMANYVVSSKRMKKKKEDSWNGTLKFIKNLPTKKVS